MPDVHRHPAGVHLFEGSALVSDGGLATELEARGHDLTDTLWSARLLADAPTDITEAHLAFYRAGASIATTASYQASFTGFSERGIGMVEAERLMRRGVELADAARAELADDGYPRWIAASVGPYGAAMPGWQSEYRGDYGLSVAELMAWHRPRMEVLADAGADVLALETVPDVVEGEALETVAADLGVPAWLTYTVIGSRTRAGQPLADAFAVADVPEIVAAGVNCCGPADVSGAIATARAVTDKPLIAYPNSGEGWNGTWFGPSRFTTELAAEWIAAGARVVGGCCRITPMDIARLVQTLHDIV